MKTKNRLVKDLIEANAPDRMVEWARDGFYDDYESVVATPIMRLVGDCLAVGLNGIAQKAKDGKYDATKEEAEVWLQKEGSRYIEQQGGNGE